MCSGSHVYTLKYPLAILCLVLNIILPGWGTMISASVCTHAIPDYEGGKCNCNCGTFADGMIQFYLSPLIFGWIWSILFGIALFKKSREFNRLMHVIRK